jgi:hypothetical protein
MPTGVIQSLEVIQIYEQQSAFPNISSAGRQGLLQPVQEQSAIRQTCQGIVEGEIPDLFMRHLQLL